MKQVSQQLKRVMNKGYCQQKYLQKQGWTL